MKSLYHLTLAKRLAAVLSACALVGTACGGSPTGPAPTAAPAAAAQPSVFDPPGNASPVHLAAAAASFTPADFEARGWECRPSPVPGRVACSHPHQGFPAVPPPADRPPTYSLLIWENGAFAGTVLLIRPDLYRGQRCESTGEPYVFRPVIGYNECLHTTGL